MSAHARTKKKLVIFADVLKGAAVSACSRVIAHFSSLALDVASLLLVSVHKNMHTQEFFGFLLPTDVHLSSRIHMWH